jgi:trehalose 6-phosphate synthase
LLGAELRRGGLAAPLGFFLHIPFPPLDIYLKLPWRFTLLRALLEYDLIGFQTLHDQRNFTQCVRALLPEVRLTHRGSRARLPDGRNVRIGAFPIGIDAAAFQHQARSQAVVEAADGLRAELPKRELILGVDRLDYTKGIIERFTAVERMLELEPSLVGRFTLLQVAAPTRSSLPEYKYFRQTVEETAQRINERFGREGRPAIVLRTTHHDSDAVRRLYRAADVALVTSLHDGMNLVAKEFIAARDDERGVLILSQFTGAARELLDALVINPYDTDASAQALHRALTMPEAEQHERMRFMRSLVREHNIYRWAGRMLADAAQVRQRQRLRQRLRAARQDAWSVQA